MIKGLGTDIIEVGRIRKTIERHKEHFYSKVFTKEELAYCLEHQDPALTLAGRFAAKEAVAKALGTGFGKQVNFLDIAIINDEAGRPYLKFSENFNELFDFPDMIVSISHCKEYATATVIWVKQNAP